MHSPIKVDEDLPLAVAEVFRGAGCHPVATIARQGWSGWTDDAVRTGIKKERMILCTADKGFADLRNLPSSGLRGVVLFRLDRESWQGYASLARKLVASVPISALEGALVVVTTRGIRIRRW